MNDMQGRRKGFGQFEIIDEDKGEVECVIATLNVKDSDGDVTLPGFFGTQETSIARAHNWSELAVGKGDIYETDTEARFRGMFNLSMPEGASAFSSVKFQGPSQEWSYGFFTFKGGRFPGTWEDQDVMFLSPLPDKSPGGKVFEVSPVFAGAGQGTRTLALKGRGVKFADHIESVIAEVDDLIERTDAIRAIRADRGGKIGDVTMAKLIEAAEGVDRLGTALGAILDTDQLDSRKSETEIEDPNQTSILEYLAGDFERKAHAVQQLIS